MDKKVYLKLKSQSGILNPAKGSWVYQSMHTLILSAMDHSFQEGTTYIITFKESGSKGDDPLYKIEFQGNGSKTISLTANMNIPALGEKFPEYDMNVPLALDIWNLDSHKCLGQGFIYVERPVRDSGDTPPAIVPDTEYVEEYSILTYISGAAEWITRSGWLGSVLNTIRYLTMGSSGQVMRVDETGENLEWYNPDSVLEDVEHISGGDPEGGTYYDEETSVLVTRKTLRRGISTDWEYHNPVLLDGEWGLETDTRKKKLGDGATAWNNLEYYGVNIPSEEEKDALKGTEGTPGDDNRYVTDEDGRLSDERDPNEHDILEKHTTIETDTNKILKPDGMEGVVFQEHIPVEKKETFTLTSEDIDNKYIEPGQTVNDPGTLWVFVVPPGLKLLQGVDFEYSGGVISWKGFPIESLLSASDVMCIVYY